MKKVFLALMLIFSLIFTGVFNPANPKDIVYAESAAAQSPKAKYLMDYTTGQVLLEENADARLPVASVVKLMTILLTLENIDLEKISLEDTIIVSQNASGMGGSQVFLENGGNYKLSDLLKSVIVCSANDASVALAEHIAGSEDNFVRLMNERAASLGMENTNYCNSTGLPCAGQFSSARDSSKVLKEVLKHKTYFEYSTIWIDKLLHSAGRETELVNTNKLVRYFKGCDGGKTGSTNEAGYCLVATAKRGDMRIIGAILGSENGKERFAQTSELLNFGFNNFVNKKHVANDELIENNIKVLGSKVKTANVKAENDMYYLQAKTDKSDIMIKYEFVKDIKAPMKKGTKVGTIYLIKDNQVVLEENIVLAEDIVKLSYWNSVIKIIDNWKIAS